MEPSLATMEPSLATMEPSSTNIGQRSANTISGRRASTLRKNHFYNIRRAIIYYREHYILTNNENCQLADFTILTTGSVLHTDSSEYSRELRSDYPCVVSELERMPHVQLATTAARA
ncbi:unnamed protein product [Danaus chrysippus]|uniref:(African queen) hypothetical protein n=1 Tax=Danaus chrysippus TaxID=151541 RepID=A0A8J2RD81_9NEOP|nr:unnamed protein product [Danaus chrysippus]